MSSMDVRTQEASAKINLGLHVPRRRADGYHAIETVLLRIPWADRLSVRGPAADEAPADLITLTCSDPALPTNERNLCVQAARRLAEEAGVEDRPVVLHLDKRVPYGAGLGGGSSDAAATLLLLNDFWTLQLAPERLQAIGATIGSDVPFFLGPTAGYATGRGEQVEPLRDPETGVAYRLPFALVVVVPPVAVSTAAAYERIQPRDHPRPDLRVLVRSNNLARWRQELGNDFEATVLEDYPAVAQARQALLEAGAGYASLSGSGSAVFGVFEDDQAALAAAEAARTAGHRNWHGRL